jgi:dihydrofolate synthase/folylpolyglutamate synthase
VGGTSGKGSTSTIIASLLGTQYKVGLHTSPHLEKVNERIQVNNALGRALVDMSDEEFVSVFNEVLPVVHQMELTEWGPPSYFEILAAMAFVYFVREQVDIAVIEVGMGGRYDGTNVVDPLVAVLTNVGLDHVEVLGDSVEKIAEDKVGIIKKGIDVVSGVTQPSVIDLVEKTCRDVGASLSLLSRDFTFQIQQQSQEGSVFEYASTDAIGGEPHVYKDLQISLLGEHQVQNASLALRTVELLAKKGFLLDEDTIRQGLVTVSIPGRLEVVSTDPFIILDGAHNGDKAHALSHAMKTIFPMKKVIIVLALKEGKLAPDILKELLTIASSFILTSFAVKIDVGEIQSQDAHVLAELIHEVDPTMPIDVIPDPVQALDVAESAATKNSVILVTGSLYLIGSLRQYFFK